MFATSMSDIKMFVCTVAREAHANLWLVFDHQMFFYNVNMLPSELFDESVSLRVRWQLFLIYFCIIF